MGSLGGHGRRPSGAGRSVGGGRVIASLGQGWMPQEFETANVPMSRQGNGMDEAMALMRACWGPDPVSYEGRSYRATPSEVNPKPVQAHVPILLGAAEDIEQEVGLMAELIGAARKST